MRRFESFILKMRTDILGALLLADQLFHELPSGRRNVLVIFSDMRQDTNDLNLETPRTLAVESSLTRTEARGMSADLGNVEVFVFGVDNARKPVPYWKSLREFWLAYFRKAGARLSSYTVCSATAISAVCSMEFMMSRGSLILLWYTKTATTGTWPYPWMESMSLSSLCWPSTT